MNKTQCVGCGYDFKEGEYEFGDVDAPVCSECWYAMIEGDPVAKSLFGIVGGLTDTEEYLE